ncbi:MAG TPA: hypothetical protein PK413_11065, partial [Thermoanaerobaculia bacterium]|nr:hypothetical protein [Thermoanaerobaculia bacterium]
MDVRGPLQELLIGLAHGRLDGAAYRAGHQEVVARALSEWGRHAELRDFAWRLPYYCLDGEESWDASPAGRSLAEVAFEFLLREPLGPSERRDLAQRLRGELFILDQLNSVTWSYGVRTRQGKDCWRFTPIIPAGVPIDPGRRFSRCLGAAVEGQEWVRIELSTAEPGAERVRPEGFLLARRLRLPRAAQRGERFWLHLERQGERGLRLLLELEGEEGEAGG